MYFTGQSLETSKEISEILGRFEYSDKDGRKQVRELMSKDEIRMMKIKQALIICGHHAPVLAKLQPYYESRIYRLYSQFPAPPIRSQSSSDNVPVLPLQSSNEE
jgi:type IV secretory pathway TraG/TraD family ATPase VirD4